MLAVFYGSDQIKVREEAHNYIDNLIKDDQLLVRLEPDNYEAGQLLNLSAAAVLFGLPPIYLLDTFSNQVDLYSELLEHLEDLASSDYIFVVIEKELNANSKKLFTKHTDKLIELKKAAGDYKFNIFSLAEALSNKDKRRLWVLLQEAKKNNLSSEEIIGTLWWQLKTLRLALLTGSSTEAGVKDFPYNKAKRALRNFKTGEIEDLSFKLLKLYHDGHAGKRDIDLALEEWVLTL